MLFLAASALVAAVLAGVGVVLGRLQRPTTSGRKPSGSARYQRLTDFEGAEHSAAISRDGQQVAFLSPAMVRSTSSTLRSGPRVSST
jgi:hypothetical protein